MSELRIPLTKTAQEIIARAVKAGDWVIDATVGNGHDTLFLAGIVGERGQVFGFDIQSKAIGAARQLLENNRLLDRVRLIQAGHQEMSAHLPANTAGRVTAIMFNLGYLPGSDKNTITRSDTTLSAIEAAISLVARDGVISILTYRGHEGGQDEYQAVAGLLESLDKGNFRVERIESPGPVLFLVKKTS